MSTLSGRAPSATYPHLLQLEGGASATPRRLETGDGTALAAWLGTAGLTLSGVTISGGFAAPGTGLTNVPAAALSGQVAVANGGTGAATASGARDNLGLGPLATGSVGAGLSYVGGVLAATGSGAGTVTHVAVSGGSTGLLFGPAVSGSGTITASGTLGIAHGGTGATTASGAANAVLPSQVGHSGKVLGTDGANPAWVAAATGGGGGLTGTVPITSGGTGATTAAGALSGLGVGPAPRPDPARDLAAADPLDGTFLLAADDLVTVTRNGEPRRVRADQLAAALDRAAGDDLLAVKVPGLAALWDDRGGFYTSVAQTTAATARGDSVASWADRTGNGRPLANTVLSPGTLLPDFSETGRTAVLHDGAQTTLGLASLSGVGLSAWCVYLVQAKPATSSSFAECGFSLGDASNGYVYFSPRRTDIGGTGCRFGGWAGGAAGYLDDPTDPGRGLAVYAMGYDGTNWKLRKQDGTWVSEAGTAYTAADRLGVGFLNRASHGYYLSGQTAAAALVAGRWPTDAEHARVVAALQARYLPSGTPAQKANLYLHGAGPSGAPRHPTLGSGLAVPYGPVGLGGAPSGFSASGMRFYGVTGSGAAKVGRKSFVDFNYQNGATAHFWFNPSALPGTGADAHLVGQWGKEGRTWRVRLNASGAVALDAAAAVSGGSVTTVTVSGGCAPGTWYPVTARWDYGAAGSSGLLRLTVGSSGASGTFAGLYRNTADSDTPGPVTVGNGWSGSGTNYYDRPFAGDVAGLYAARSCLPAADVTALHAGLDVAPLAGPAVVVDAPQGVVQRSLVTDTASPVVRGRYRMPGTVPLEYSLDGGAWTAGPSGLTQGVFEFTVPDVPVGRHTLAVRVAGRPDVAHTVRFAVGDVFVLAGQSNMVGSLTNPQRYDGPAGYAWFADQTWRVRPLAEHSLGAAGYQGAVDVTSDGVGYACWPRVAARLTAQTGVPVMFVMAARSGTDSATWAPPAASGDPDTLFGAMARHATARGGCRAVLWWQGENDAAFFVSQSQYEARLDAVASGVAAQLGVTLGVVVLQQGAGGTLSAIQAAQYGRATGGGTYRLVANLSGVVPTPNAVHFTTDTEADSLVPVLAAGVLSNYY